MWLQRNTPNGEWVDLMESASPRILSMHYQYQKSQGVECRVVNRDEQGNVSVVNLLKEIL
jgi:hypothetical protein